LFSHRSRLLDVMKKIFTILHLSEPFFSDLLMNLDRL
jgi:hypothetical protein